MKLKVRISREWEDRSRDGSIYYTHSIFEENKRTILGNIARSGTNCKVYDLADNFLGSANTLDEAAKLILNKQL